MADFISGRTILYMTMQVKLSTFDRLPHRPLACVHDDAKVRQQSAATCLGLFQALLEHLGLRDGDPKLQALHPLIVNVFCNHKHDLEKLAGGMELEDLPDLLRLLMPLRFANMLELTVESKHALAKARVRQSGSASPELFNFELLIWGHQRVVEAGRKQLRRHGRELQQGEAFVVYGR